MNPQNPASFNHRSEKLSTGRTYHFVDQLPENHEPASTPLILAVHGFPDCWYGFRYQISPWVSKGFRVVVPDMLGYGATDKPLLPSEYSTRKLCDDLAALLDLLGVQKAILVGHDWGSFTVGRFALWYPDRLLAMTMMSVPFTPPAREYISVEDMAKLMPKLAYQAYFADEKSTGELEAKLPLFLKMVFLGPAATDHLLAGNFRERLLTTEDIPIEECVLTREELDYYLTQFKQGMQGPLSYYRTARYRFEEEKAAEFPPTLRSDLPCLYISGTSDPTTLPDLVRRSSRWVLQLKVVELQGIGHWVMVEARDVVTETVLNWLGSLGLDPSVKASL